MGKRMVRARAEHANSSADELDAWDPERILAAAELNIAHRRRGFPGRVHLSPLDVYTASEQYQDKDFRSDYNNMPDMPRAIWSSHDDDIGRIEKQLEKPRKHYRKCKNYHLAQHGAAAHINVFC